MSPRGVVVTSLGCVALAVTLAGLFTRGLASRCYFFAVHLATVCAGDLADVSYRAADLARASNEPGEAARLLRAAAEIGRQADPRA